MEAAQFFIQLAGILVFARVGAEVAVRFGAPSVIGELVAGIVLGPSLLGWLEATEVIRLLAEIGIILLLFEVGLETDLSRLASSGVRSGVVAVGGFVFPFLLGFGASRYLFGHEMLLALFIGGTLTATSIGVTVRILRDVRRQDSREGQIVLGAAVIDDILGVLLLAVLYDFSQTGVPSLAHLGELALFIGVFFVLAPVAAKLTSLVLGRYHSVTEMPGLVATLIVSLVMVFAWLAHAFGAPELLGGFAAGMALSRRFFLPFGAAIASDGRFAAEVERDMKPIVQLFTPIFFVTVGLSLDLRAVDWGSPFIWLFSIGVGFISIAGKILGGWLLVKEHWLMRTAVGMAMVPRGEVGLIFAELGRSTGILDAATYAAVVLVIAYTTLFSPFWIKMFYRLYGEHPALKPP
ncbi:MAG: cation:proton antiporter [Pseudomonadales bacterium]|jgi:Kef-type K+ transport system membrane component KefB|nr:cation:proton antiporter [Pseudomonadales bacterium]